VSVSAGLARAGKKVFAASPACFLASRSLEQVKVDVAYSDTNVKLIGISGGISYGALGMTHHSAQDIAAIASIPGMRVYLPSDRVQTEQLLTALLQDQKPAYIRVGRNAVPDVYSENNRFTLNQAGIVAEGRDLAIIACGEMVAPAKLAAEQLLQVGIHARVIDMYCLKPIDEAAVLRAARECGGILTVEEHCKIGGLGGMVSQLVCEYCPAKVLSISLPDEP
ncbi:MAG: transketolase C-terminal domain-containing protein, partial [Oscillospiraceae bacterium]